jgi:glycosyltransferase involved in cell wall biosynthesis
MENRPAVPARNRRHGYLQSNLGGASPDNQWANVVDVSVIIPCHNAGEFALEAVESAVRQSEVPREILLADDASTDGATERIHELYPNVHILRGRFGGASNARNAGLREARGAFVAFLDADDRWDQDHLARALGFLGQGSDTAYLGHFDLLDEAGRRRSISLLPELSTPRWGLGLEDFLQFFLRGLPNGSASYVARREAVAATGGFDPSQLRANDLDFWLRLIRLGTWCYDPHPAVCYRMRSGGNLSHDVASRSYFRLRALLRLRESGVPPSPALDSLVQYWKLQTVRTAAIRGSREDWKRATTLVDPAPLSVLGWRLLGAVRSCIGSLGNVRTARS